MGAMSRSPLDPHVASPSELKQRLEADRAGLPYLVYRDAGERQVIRMLDPSASSLAVGRSPRSDIALGWDRSVSWTHATVGRVGDDWVIEDDGLSRTGTFVGAERVAGQRRLQDGDVIRIGATLLAFRAPSSDPSTGAARPSTRQTDEPPTLSGAQRRVLAALCRPYVTSGRAYPATNREIADELYLSVVTVKGHLRTLCELFEVGSLRQNQKRAELMHRALAVGAVTDEDYR
jgi:pSer/pThr/pTyr-binding forkhead associated (FHA) protein/DNA-binding CsgD family transcriptional regulator